METKYIYAGIVVAFFVFMFAWGVSVNNAAIGFDENIQQSQSGISVQKERQRSLILQLVQVVEQASKYEAGVQSDIAKLRTVAKDGNIGEAQIIINAVSEAVPTLQANQAYLQLMTEMSISENLVTEYRNTYNSDVRNYSRFVRRFPNKLFLSVSGYEIYNYEYLDFQDTELPQDIFKDQ